jgi:hypothetical protein
MFFFCSFFFFFFFVFDKGGFRRSVSGGEANQVEGNGRKRGRDWEIRCFIVYIKGVRSFITFPRLRLAG